MDAPPSTKSEPVKRMEQLDATVQKRGEKLVLSTNGHEREIPDHHAIMKEARANMDSKMAAFSARLQKDGFDRWESDLEKGTIHFYLQGGKVLQGEVNVVGSVSYISESYLAAHHNDNGGSQSFSRSALEASVLVEKYGKQFVPLPWGIRLSSGYWTEDVMEEAKDRCALALHLWGGDSVWSNDNGNGIAFFVFRNLQEKNQQ